MVALGSAALLLAGGYAAATFTGLREQTIRNGVGHLQVGGPGFSEEERARSASGIADVGRAASGDRPRTRASRPRPRASSSPDSRRTAIDRSPCSAAASSPSTSTGERTSARAWSTGRPVAAGAAHEAMAAAGLARSLNLKLGDRMTLLSATVDGAINGVDTEIVGIYTTGVRELDERSLVVRVDTAQALLNTTRVSKLVVLLDSAARHAARARRAARAAQRRAARASKSAPGPTSRASITRSAASTAASSASSASSSRGS